jgi:hypothetical protein
VSLRRFIGVSLTVAFVSLVLIACGDPSHIYEGRAYLDSRDCLGTTSSVDVVEGDRPTRACAAICLADGHPDGGRTLYVSTMCAPYPFQFDASGGDPGCPAALEALGRDDTCNTKGTSTHPIRDAAAE